MKEARFLLTVAPFLFLLAALGPLGWAVPRLARAPAAGAVATLVAVLAVGGVAVAAVGPAAQPRLARDHRALTAAASYRAPLALLVERVAGPGRHGLLGGFNELSESLVRWQAWREHGREADLADPLRGLVGSDSEARVRQRLAGWLERERPDRLVTVRPLPRSPVFRDRDYRRWNGWQLVAIRALASDPAWRPRQRRRDRATGLEIVTWERARTR
jgi:hypothetical protein